MRVWKQWTDEDRTTRKTGSGRWKVASARDDRHLHRMMVNSRTASFRQLAARWSIAAGVLMSASSIRRSLLHLRLGVRVHLYRIPLTANHQRLQLHWAHEHRARQADWPQVVFSDESRFNLWDHDGRIRIKRHVVEHCLPGCVVAVVAKWYRYRTVACLVTSSRPVPLKTRSGAISYHGRSNLIRIESNLKSNRCVHEVLQPEFIPFLQGIPEAIFQQDNARLHIAKTVRDFCSVQHMQLLPWPAYSPDMSLIEYVWDLVSRCLVRGPRPAASKDELLLRIQAIWNSLPLADIQKLFNSILRRIAALIAARGGYTKY
ncbi:transposable element Tcb2 transposase [Trichonephila clavipes]|nr:transposable element Tcb2 transposase [Trichonephila clavipes]